MRAEAARVRRLVRLEKVRAHAKQAAAIEAAEAEGALARLSNLASRTQAMVDDYSTRSSHADGLELRQIGQFVAGLAEIFTTTRDDADQARIAADRKQQELAEAERRRAAVEDRARAGERALARRLIVPVLGSRRPVGTTLE